MRRELGVLGCESGARWEQSASSLGPLRAPEGLWRDWGVYDACGGCEIWGHFRLWAHQRRAEGLLEL